MALTLAVDFEQLTSRYLRGRSELTDLLDGRPAIYTTIPEGATFPLVLLLRPPLGENLTGPALHLTRAVLDIHSYGGPQKHAFRIAETVRALLMLPDFLGVHTVDDLPVGTITDVDIGGFGYVPDVGFNKPRPRYIATIDLYGHS